MTGNEHTALKDRSFGLGVLAKERPDIIEKEAQRSSMKGVTFSERHSYVKGARAMGVTQLDIVQRNHGSSSTSSKDGYSDLLGEVDMPGEHLDINKEINNGMGSQGGPTAPSTSVTSIPSKGKPAASVGGGAHETNSKQEVSDVANLPETPTEGGGGGGGLGKKRKLTKLEEQYMAKALVRQKNNIVQKQVVWGKEFKGQAFISKPDRVVFKDFEVGQKMRTRFTLTNTSFTFNHFKLLSLPDEIKDFFELTFVKPGRMSAGMTCSIIIEFEPKLNMDIISSIPLLAQTGAFYFLFFVLFSHTQSFLLMKYIFVSYLFLYHIFE